MRRVTYRSMIVAFVIAVVLAMPTMLRADNLIQTSNTSLTGKSAIMRIRVQANGQDVTFELNESRAAMDLVAQLPLEIAVENYGGIEKIFYPPRKLDTTDTPLAENVTAGLLAYYAPWGNVVMFFDDFRPADGLYELGRVHEGGAMIENLSGTIRIEKLSVPDN